MEFKCDSLLVGPLNQRKYVICNNTATKFYWFNSHSYMKCDLHRIGAAEVTLEEMIILEVIDS
jgi:hypothetical protein